MYYDRRDCALGGRGLSSSDGRAVALVAPQWLPSMSRSEPGVRSRHILQGARPLVLYEVGLAMYPVDRGRTDGGESPQAGVRDCSAERLPALRLPVTLVVPAAPSFSTVPPRQFGSTDRLAGYGHGFLGDHVGLTKDIGGVRWTRRGFEKFARRPLQENPSFPADDVLSA